MTPKEQSAFSIDALYCEESIENDDFTCESSQICSQNVPIRYDVCSDDFAFESLFLKETELHPRLLLETLDESLVSSRKEAIEWILSVKNHFGFSAITAVLAVNYFDRFISTEKFLRDKPWMNQLTAVACLSVAAKVDETFVPLLVDLQVEDSKFIFEAKTIKRMELLVLSTLHWRMHPVTPISFFDYIISKLKLNLDSNISLNCEGFLLSIISDARIMIYNPSVIASSIILLVTNQNQSKHQLLDEMKVNLEEVNACCLLIKESSYSPPNSPNGVIDAHFMSDSSNDSWAVSSVSNKRKQLDDEVQSSSQKRMFFGVLGYR